VHVCNFASVSKCVYVCVCCTRVFICVLSCVHVHVLVCTHHALRCSIGRALETVTVLVPVLSVLSVLSVLW
jgi:hypothetical protein